MIGYRLSLHFMTPCDVISGSEEIISGHGDIIPFSEDIVSGLVKALYRMDGPMPGFVEAISRSNGVNAFEDAF